MDEQLHFFGEWVYWDTQEELEDAYKYLALWKKFILKKLSGMEQVSDDQIVLRPPRNEESLKEIMPNLSRGTLGVKFAMKGIKPDFVLDEYDIRKLASRYSL